MPIIYVTDPETGEQKLEYKEYEEKEPKKEQKKEVQPTKKTSFVDSVRNTLEGDQLQKLPLLNKSLPPRMVVNAGINALQEGSDTIRDIGGYFGVGEGTTAEEPDKPIIGMGGWKPQKLKSSGGVEDFVTGVLQFGLEWVTLSKALKVANLGLKGTKLGTGIATATQKAKGIEKAIQTGTATTVAKTLGGGRKAQKVGSLVGFGAGAATNATLAGAVRRTPPKKVAEYVIKGGDSITDYQLIFVDNTEKDVASNKARGITGPGWWLYRTYTDVSGRTRHKAECLAFVHATATAAGDDTDDSILGDFKSVIAISSQPSNQNTSSGAATFAVVAASTGQAAGIDGKQNAGNTGGRTAGTYAITATGGTGSGATFSVVIASNGSANVSLTNGGGGYTDNDVITLSRTGAYGGASDITVKVNGINNGTLTYQWQKRLTSSGRFANVSGATSASLVLSSQAAGNTGNQYRVRVNNGVGATEVVSNTATLTFAS